MRLIWKEEEERKKYVNEGRNIKEIDKEKYRLEMKNVEERINLKGTEKEMETGLLIGHGQRNYS